jgi:light-regulated signal transduction histidine kinase (bacteriophytochrome)
VSTGAKQTGTVDLTRVAKEVASDLEIVIKNNDASVEVENLPSVEADPIQMRQLFQNLMSNALKFHGEKNPVVKIFARTAGNTSHDIFIEDNGIGFEERDLDRIFTLFQRLHGRSAYEGRGIGLAICRKIVERHHGSITARSKPGQGATFIVTLPEKQPSESDASVM